MFEQNGQDILDNLGALKPKLLDNYDQWKRQHQDEPNNDCTPDANYSHVEIDDQHDQGYNSRGLDHRYDDIRLLDLERERERDKEGHKEGSAGVMEVESSYPRFPLIFVTNPSHCISLSNFRCSW